MGKTLSLVVIINVTSPLLPKEQQLRKSALGIIFFAWVAEQYWRNHLVTSVDHRSAQYASRIHVWSPATSIYNISFLLRIHGVSFLHCPLVRTSCPENL